MFLVKYIRWLLAVGMVCFLSSMSGCGIISQRTEPVPLDDDDFFEYEKLYRGARHVVTVEITKIDKNRYVLTETTNPPERNRPKSTNYVFDKYGEVLRVEVETPSVPVTSPSGHVVTMSPPSTIKFISKACVGHTLDIWLPLDKREVGEKVFIRMHNEPCTLYETIEWKGWTVLVARQSKDASYEKYYDIETGFYVGEMGTRRGTILVDTNVEGIF